MCKSRGATLGTLLLVTTQPAYFISKLSFDLGVDSSGDPSLRNIRALVGKV